MASRVARGLTCEFIIKAGGHEPADEGWHPEDWRRLRMRSWSVSMQRRAGPRGSSRAPPLALLCPRRRGVEWGVGGGGEAPMSEGPAGLKERLRVRPFSQARGGYSCTAGGQPVCGVGGRTVGTRSKGERRR